MRLFNKVAIIGTGLIGGSLALAIKKMGLAKEVVGVTQHKSSLKLALRNKVIDRGSLSFSIIQGADLLILATPVDSIIALRKKILRLIASDCIVTDVGSTKVDIVRALEGGFPNFVGSHPLAGSEKRGVGFAKPDIFYNSLCIITPTKKTSINALKKIKSLWKALGTRILVINPEEHDKILGFTSHLPHLIAFSLINSIPSDFLRFSSGGLRDTTRIASSSPLIWQGILLTNRKNSLKALDTFKSNLLKIKSAIAKNDKKLLLKILTKAQQKRNILE